MLSLKKGKNKISEALIKEEANLAQLVSSIGSSFKKMKNTMIHPYSFYEYNSDPKYTESEYEEGEYSRFIHGGKRSKFISNPYIQRPHTRPKNKIRLNSKLIYNLALRDEIINIDESLEDKTKKKKDQPKSQTQRKRSGKRVTKAGAIRIFPLFWNSKE